MRSRLARALGPKAVSHHMTRDMHVCCVCAVRGGSGIARCKKNNVSHIAKAVCAAKPLSVLCLLRWGQVTCYWWTMAPTRTRPTRRCGSGGTPCCRSAGSRTSQCAPHLPNCINCSRRSTRLPLPHSPRRGTWGRCASWCWKRPDVVGVVKVAVRFGRHRPSNAPQLRPHPPSTNDVEVQRLRMPCHRYCHGWRSESAGGGRSTMPVAELRPVLTERCAT